MTLLLEIQLLMSLSRVMVSCLDNFSPVAEIRELSKGDLIPSRDTKEHATNSLSRNSERQKDLNRENLDDAFYGDAHWSFSARLAAHDIRYHCGKHLIKPRGPHI